MVQDFFDATKSRRPKFPAEGWLKDHLLFCLQHDPMSNDRWWFQVFLFHPIWGKITQLTDILEMGGSTTNWYRIIVPFSGEILQDMRRQLTLYKVVELIRGS